MKHLFVFALVSNLVIAPLQAQTLNETFENTTPITDAEQATASNYYHTGKAQKILTEECKKLGQTYDSSTMACTDTGAGSVFGGSTGGMIEEMLPKLYTIMGTAAAATGGGKIQMKPKADAKPAEGADKAKGEEKSDVCIYIPMAGEVIASGMQTLSQNQIQQTTTGQTGADIQKEALYAVARTHTARAKTANIQGGVYGATAGCYVAYMASGAVIDWKILLKTGAAAAMSTIFFIKAGKEKGFADDVTAIAKKLPGSGDCNPITATNCFCNESTSRNMDLTNWTKYCVPQALAANSTGTKTAIPCATINASGGATLDESCACKKSNSCLNGQIANLANQIGFGGTELADPLRLLNDMTGSMDDANISNFATQLNARAKGLLNKATVGDIPNVSLSKNDAAVAKELNKLGLPSGLAAYAASQKGSSAASSASAPALANYGSGSENAAYKSSKGVSYGYAGSSSSSRKNGSEGFKNPLDKGKANGVQIDTFAEQAVAAADITKDTSVGIFDLISNRYRRSAWSRFEMDKLIQEVPATPTETQPVAEPTKQ